MSTDTTNERYGLSTDHWLHLRSSATDWWGVWLNPTEKDFSGVPLGAGQTRAAAIDDAIATLNEAQARLMKER